MIDANTGMHIILNIALTLWFGRICYLWGKRKKGRTMVKPNFIQKLVLHFVPTHTFFYSDESQNVKVEFKYLFADAFLKKMTVYDPKAANEIANWTFKI